MVPEAEMIPRRTSSPPGGILEVIFLLELQQLVRGISSPSPVESKTRIVFNAGLHIRCIKTMLIRLMKVGLR